ncbi:MAG: flippase [Endozoicomonas sp. (ex Botrylloides leachii)]|nr:flippase [Endozoicomonas sp. (ex Botrylloides leachii)]
MYQRLKSLITASALLLNIGVTLGRQLLAAAVQLLIVVLIARNLGPEGNGFYAMAILIPTMLANFLNLGIAPATIYFISQKQFSIKRAMIENTKFALVIASAGEAIALPVLFIWGEHLFPAIPLSLLFISLLAFPLILYAAFNAAILQGLQDFRAFNASVLLPPIVSVIVVFITFYMLDMGIYGALTAYILGQLAASMAVFIFLKRHVAKEGPINIDQDVDSATYYKAVIGYGSRAYLSNILAFINYKVDLFLVNLFLTPAAVGIYAIAVQIAEKLWMPSQAVSTVLFPKLSTMSEQPVARLKLTNTAFLLVAAITTALSLLVVLMLHLFVTLIFGRAYLSIFPAFYWLLPGIVCWAGARIQSNCIAAWGKPEWNMYLSLVVLIINITGNILLIPRYGIIGAAAATSIAYVLDAIVKVIIMTHAKKSEMIKSQTHN